MWPWSCESGSLLNRAALVKVLHLDLSKLPLHQTEDLVALGKLVISLVSAQQHPTVPQGLIAMCAGLQVGGGGAELAALAGLHRRQLQRGAQEHCVTAARHKEHQVHFYCMIVLG